ncbi:unnamed protein product, partial [Tilletia controversa]
GRTLVRNIIVGSSTFLSVEGDATSDKLGSRLGREDGGGLVDGRAGCDDVVDDEDALALERGTDEAYAIPVRLGLLAIMGEAYVDVVVPGVKLSSELIQMMV